MVWWRPPSTFSGSPPASPSMVPQHRAVAMLHLSSSLPMAQLAHHDFGGGPLAELRVVESVLAAGSTHTLRVTYTLGPPQASTAGSYQPAMM